MGGTKGPPGDVIPLSASRSSLQERGQDRTYCDHHSPAASQRGPPATRINARCEAQDQEICEYERFLTFSSLKLLRSTQTTHICHVCCYVSGTNFQSYSFTISAMKVQLPLFYQSGILTAHNWLYIHVTHDAGALCCVIVHIWLPVSILGSQLMKLQTFGLKC